MTIIKTNRNYFSYNHDHPTEASIPKGLLIFLLIGVATKRLVHLNPNNSFKHLCQSFELCNRIYGSFSFSSGLKMFLLELGFLIFSQAIFYG
jgi:hypothetical protein